MTMNDEKFPCSIDNPEVWSIKPGECSLLIVALAHNPFGVTSRVDGTVDPLGVSPKKLGKKGFGVQRG
eukprot:977699-Amphidinium_carterae.1